MDMAKKSKNAGMYVCIHYRYLSKLMKPPWKAVQNFLKKKLARELPCDPSVPLLKIYINTPHPITKIRY